MTHKSRCLAAGALLAAVLLSPAAHAALIDFEPADLTGLYLPGETFSQGAYVLTTTVDFGFVDVASSLGSQAPTGNLTQFYFASNDAHLSVTHASGTGFNLEGFSAAFVALDPPATQTTVIVARGTLQDNSQITAFWQFAPSNTSNFPFTAYSGAAFSAFVNLKKVDFYACSFVGGLPCTAATQNNGQFAIDNISVNVVPEPGAALLMALGLSALGLGMHRRASAG